MKEVKTKTCPKCDGRGTIYDHEQEEAVLCRKCDGIGQVCKCHNHALYRCSNKHED